MWSHCSAARPSSTTLVSQRLTSLDESPKPLKYDQKKTWIYCGYLLAKHKPLLLRVCSYKGTCHLLPVIYGKDGAADAQKHLVRFNSLELPPVARDSVQIEHGNITPATTSNPLLITVTGSSHIFRQEQPSSNLPFSGARDDHVLPFQP